jgi:Ca2+-binding RTX toxin-like protein
MSTANAGLYGGEGNDYIDGDEGNDYVDGGNGVDVLVGGLGADALNGGNDGDIFLYFSAKESKRGATKADHILDFELGFDEIDLREMDANKKKDGLQKFKFIGKKGFHDKAGELRYKAGKAEADVNGDGKADWQVFIDDRPKLGFDDFNL